MSYKRLIPCIFIKDGKAVRWIDDPTVVSKDVIELAKYYSDHGADELIVLDLSDSDEEHDETITLMKRINRVIRIPMIAGGNIRRQEDIKKILYTGAKRAMLNFSKPDSVKLIEDAAKRFGKEKLAVSLNDFDALFKHQHLIQDYSSEIVFMHRLDLNSIMNVTDVPCVIITDTEEESELFKILKCPGVRGLSGRYVSRTDIDCVAFKDKCTEEGIKMTSFESMMEFSQFKTNDQGLIPVIVQHYKTQEILMLAYMNEESFYETIKTGKMTYFSRSRQKLWVKGETSGHFQYVKSLTIDCDLDTLLAKSDIISIHAPLNEHTEGLMDKAAFAKMKKTCIFLNLGRGPIVVEQDLYEALENDEIAAAGLDVLCQEPMSETNPLRKIKDSKKLLITPHVAWASVEARTKLMGIILGQIKEYFQIYETGVVA